MKKFFSRLFKFTLLLLLIAVTVFATLKFSENKEEQDKPYFPNQPSNPITNDQVLTPKELYRQNKSGVLYIQTQTGGDSLLNPRSGGQGSGFLVDDKGYIITNAHVIEGANKISVIYDEKVVKAKLVGKDNSTDLALLKISEADLKSLKISKLALGNSEKIEVGDPVMAIGNPLGYDHSLTTGVISALGRDIPSPNGFTIGDVIQTDTSINPGNSGGPLFNAQGEVVGVTSQIATDGRSETNIGIGFAIPINTVKNLIPQLKKGKVETPYLGVQGISSEAFKTHVSPDVKLPKEGVVVASVTPNSPSAKAGLQAMSEDQVKDIITQIDQQKVSSIEEILAFIQKKNVGDKVKLKVYRGNKEKEIEVTLEARPQTKIN